jgi:hypothetical protein
MLIVCLVKEYVFTVAPICRPVFEDALFIYTMFGAEPLPEDGAHYSARMERMRVVRLSCCYALCTLVAALADLYGHNFARHALSTGRCELQQSTHETRARVRDRSYDTHRPKHRTRYNCGKIPSQRCQSALSRVIMIICGVRGLEPARQLIVLLVWRSTRRYRDSSNAKTNKKMQVREHGCKVMKSRQWVLSTGSRQYC